MRKYIQIISFLLAAVTLSGCENWLDVKPETEVNEDDMFNTEQGFMDALYGIYVNMGKSDLYGGTLQTALDMTAQYYSYYDISECPYGHYQTFEYEHPSCTAISDALWMRIYYCIGLTNNLLKYLDKPEAVQICSNYDYLRGEALALRAYLHFELIRIFAPDVKKNPEYKSIPYRKTFSPDIEPQLKVKEVYQEILADLTEAKQLLSNDVIRTNGPDWLGESEKKEESDDVTDKNEGYYTSDFLKTRKYRMNYYAVLGTLARVHLTLGTTDDMEKAYDYAMEVIESGKFRPIQEEHILVSGEQAKYRDILFTDEFIFGLYSAQVDAFYKSNFDESYGVKKILINKLSDIYGQGTRDLRQTHWFKTSWGTSYLLKHNADLEYAKEKVRMITLAEMYYIAAEAHPAEAYDLLEEILPSREIHSSLPVNAGRTEVLTEVLKEYRKEYIGDGQFFYAYKRLIEEEAAIHPLGINIPNENKVLVWPLPQDEIKYGDRYMGKTFRMGKILCGFNYRLWEPVKISTEIIKWSLLPIAVPVRKVWISIS